MPDVGIYLYHYSVRTADDDDYGVKIMINLRCKVLDDVIEIFHTEALTFKTEIDCRVIWSIDYSSINNKRQAH